MELKFTITDESEGCQWRGPGTDDSDYIFTVQPFETHKWELWKHAGFKLVFEYEIVSNTPVDLSTQLDYISKHKTDLNEVIVNS